MSARERWALCARAADVALLGDIGRAAQQAAWVEVHSGAVEARAALASRPDTAGAWVVSSDEVQAVNLAAALKGDNPALAVFLVGDESPSTRSCAHAAGIDGVLGYREFAEHFEVVRRAAEGTAEHAAPEKAESRPSAPDAWFGQAAAAAETVVAEGDAGGIGPAGHSGFLLAVVSGSGGAGKSTVCALIARLAVRRGLRVALLDGDLQFGDLRELAAPCAQLDVEQVAASASVLDEFAEDRLLLVAAPCNLEQAEAVAGSFDAVVARLTARYDLVVVNTGGSWGELHARLLEQAAASVLLIDQRASSVRACRHALDLCLRCGIATGSFVLAVNRCGRHAPFTSADVSSALRGAHVAELVDGGREVEELMGAGLAEQLIDGGNGLCASLGDLLDELLPAPAAPSAQSSVIARFGVAGAREREPKRSRKGRSKGRRERAKEAAAEALPR